MTSQIAENYQLKWHSHLTNLNSSVATLYRNEKFADVLLFTSNADNTSGIPAHKIILSSCSHFFASIFELNQSPPNAMIYVVLPPELSKRSIQILIQYMYSGEATVSNDILSEVLRGGEVLKIRGLWRNNQTSEPNASSTPQYHSTTAATAPPMPMKIVDSGYPVTPKETTQLINEKQTIYDHRQERLNVQVVKESPVIVMSPRQSHLSLPLPPSSPSSQQSMAPPSAQSLPSAAAPTLTQHSNSNLTVGGPMQTLLVKKELAINPAVSEQSHYGLVSLQIAAAAAKKAQQTTDKRIKSTIQAPPLAMASHHQHHQHHHENGNDPLRRYSTGDDQSRSEMIVDNTSSSHPRILRESDVLRMSDKRRLSVSIEHQRHHLDPGEKSRIAGKLVTEKKQMRDVQIPEALSFLTIKQEPLEWNEYDQENGVEKSQIEVTVKPEIVYADECESEDDGDVNDDHDEMVYSPLTCELCSETFTIPGEWVRHIEGHTEATQCVPKKRKRIDESTSENIAALRCDLCAMYFVTPAEWVRHVQNTHTETELALSNNSAPPKRNYQRPNRPNDGQPLEKSCSVCKKTFPSYASMIIHKRTHTGERPFYCSLCNKGFNVKSNLLRHMRTLHNQLINPSNVNDLPDGNNPE